MFMALLRQQQENFEGFVKVIMENTRLEALAMELQEVKASLQFTQKDVDDNKTDINRESCTSV